MTFTNRWVCKVEDGFNLNNLKTTLQDYYNSSPGESYDLSTMTSVEAEIISTNGTHYLPGKLVYQVERPFEDTEINEDRQLVKVPDVRRLTFVTDFWISSKGNILFRNSSDITKQGKDILSELLFGDVKAIKNKEYDIERIEAAVNNGQLSGMWTYCFKERNGNIKSATAYGNDVNKDPIYGQTAGSPRNFIGVEETIDQNLIKVAVFRYGSINVLADYEDPLELPKIFKIIEKFEVFSSN